MTNSNSKHIQPNKLISSNGMPVRDEYGSLDLHCWVEDNRGDVIYDPYFTVYDDIKKHWNCEGEPIRESMPDWKLLTDEAIAIKLEKGIKGDWDNPQPFECVMNSYSFCQAFEEYKFVVGRLGWKKQSGGIHWEFG